MNWAVTHLWRYPIKGIGAEALAQIDVDVDRPFPLDRAWAVLEDGGDASDGWRSCRNFLRGAKGPSLMAITAQTDGENLTLSHPELDDLTIVPAEGRHEALFQWLAPIYPENRQVPVVLVKSPPEGMSDAPFASISIMNHASLRAVSQEAGRDMDMRRFRGNIWVDGLAPWEEFDLVGKTVCIGTAELEVIEPITRCRATEANPVTGKRDVSTLQVLEQGWGHTEFGVNAMVRKSGTLAGGDVGAVQ